MEIEWTARLRAAANEYYERLREDEVLETVLTAVQCQGVGSR